MVDEHQYIDNILGKHFAGERLSAEEESVLVDWVVGHQEEYERLSKAFRPSGAAGGAFEASAAWERVQPQLHRSNRRGWHRFSWAYACAASVLLVLGISLFWESRSEAAATLYANAGTALRTVLLPDSSSVVLYPDTKIEYLAHAGRGERSVHLQGKAFFKVNRQEGQAFVVKTDGVDVSVLGTSFMVSNAGGRTTEVQVREGRVSVSTPSEEVILTVNEQAQVNGRQIEKCQIADPLAVFKDQIKQKTYRSTPLEEVLQEVEEEFGVEIVMDEALHAARISTQIDLVYLEEILTELSYICNCHWEKISEKKYHLSISDTL